MKWLQKLVNKLKLNCTDPAFWYWEMPVYIFILVVAILKLTCASK